MIYIVSAEMPENCQECPFLYAGLGAACCTARARYEAATDGKWGIRAPLLFDGNDEQRDSSCPLYEDSEVDAVLKEYARLKRERWISVEDKLPPRSGPYLCHCTRWGDFERQILTWFSDTQTWQKNYCAVDMTQFVDFWMELPDPPENGKE